MMRKYKVTIETFNKRKYTFPWEMNHAYVEKAKHIAELFLEYKYVEVKGAGKKCTVVPIAAIDNLTITEETEGQYSNDSSYDG